MNRTMKGLCLGMLLLCGLAYMASAAPLSLNATPPGPRTFTTLSGTTTTITGTANKRVKVLELLFTPTASTTLNIKDGSSSLTGDMTVTGIYQQYNGIQHYETSAGADLVIVTGATATGYVITSVE